MKQWRESLEIHTGEKQLSSGTIQQSKTIVLCLVGERRDEHSGDTLEIHFGEKQFSGSTIEKKDYCVVSEP